MPTETKLTAANFSDNQDFLSDDEGEEGLANLLDKSPLDTATWT